MCTVSSVSAYDTNTLESQAQTQQQNSGDSVYGDFEVGWCFDYFF